MNMNKPMDTSSKSSWPPIVVLKYPSGKTAFQVACMIQGKRLREAYPTKGEAETRAMEIRTMIQNEGAGALMLPMDNRVEAGKAVEKLKPYNATITHCMTGGLVAAFTRSGECFTIKPVSPTVFRFGPYRFFFFSREEKRMHVHVYCGDGEAKFWIQPRVALAKNYGLTRQQLTAVNKMIEVHRDEIIQSWRTHFSS